MRDPLDRYLPYVSGESPAPDLAARIITTLAQRQRTRLMWRRLGAVMLVCALLGLALILVSWSHVADSLNPVWGALETNDLAPLFDTLITAPSETLANWLEAGLTWQAAQAEDIGIMFTLGLALLSVAAFGGLAHLLNTSAPGEYSR
jgi:hypothetical protein